MISVLMPVFNIENKASKFSAAVSSVTGQSYKDIELIIINDGSTDNSEPILNRLMNEDNRIRVVTKANGGVESARRKGLECAKGDYILHMDQDDMYRKDAIELFLQRMKETDADVVVANHARFFLTPYLQFGRCKAESVQTERLIGHDTFMANYYVSFFGINDLPVNIWNKMYRRSFLEAAPIPPLTGHIIEDLSYNMHILPYAKKIAVMSEVLYYYRWGGFTNRYDSTILDTALTGYQLKTAQISKYGLVQFLPHIAVELVNYLNTYFYQLVEYRVYNREQFISEAKRILALDEVLACKEQVCAYGRYHNAYTDAILEDDYIGLYDYEVMMRKRNWKKILAKKLLLNI